MSTIKLRIPKIANCNSQSVLLNIIRDQGPVSRSRLVEYSNQPLAAVSRTISRLMADQIVLEIPMGDDTGPRRKRALCLNPNLGHCLSIDYGPDEISAIALNTAYGPILKKQDSFPLKTMTRHDRIKTFIEYIRRCQSEIPSSAGPCLAICFVDPGVIDEANGTVLMSSILDNWTQVPITEIIEKEFKIPVMLLNTNTTNIRAVDRFELKNAFQNFVYVEYQSGISCGIKLQGNYITGRSYLAGEFGHMKVTDQPIPCRCGAAGCLEAIAAMPALAQKYQYLLQRIPDDRSQLPDKIAGLDVLRLSAEGHRLAQRVVEEAFEYLGNAIGGLVNLLAPDVVVLDHRIRLAGDEAVGVLLHSAKKSMLSIHVPSTDIRISMLHSNIPSLGGAVALLDTMIDY